MKKILSIVMLLALLVSQGHAQISAGKAVQILIQGVPPEEKSRIDSVYPVSESGTINMPFIGHVQAAGLTSEALAANIQARYRSAGIYTTPTIQVISDTEKANVNVQKIFVGGQVRRTGEVPFTRGLTLYQAIQAAGGPTEFGSIKRVKLFRGGKQNQFDLTQSQFMRVPLEDGDTIEVPQKDFLGR